MRGNNKRKLVPKVMLEDVRVKFNMGVPLNKMIRLNKWDISRPHLKKLLLIYIDILDESFDMDYRESLAQAILPEWLEDKTTITEQPDEWTYIGKFPFGVWKEKE